MKISLSASTIRADIRSAIALKCSLGSIPALPLSIDRDPALNRQIAFYFSQLLIRIASAVEEYSISPGEYDSQTAAEVLLEADLRDDCLDIEARNLRFMIEEYVTDMSLACMLADISPRQSELHELSAKTTLNHITTLIHNPGDDLHCLRLARSI